MYNYRLSRAKNSVECSFGRMAQMWQILFRQIDEQPEAATDIVKAITVLHNFLIIIFESERSTVKSMGTENEVTPEEMADYSSASNLHVNIDASGSRATQNGIKVREDFMNYFTSQEGSVHWQENHCHLKK